MFSIYFRGKIGNLIVREYLTCKVSLKSNFLLLSLQRRLGPRIDFGTRHPNKFFPSKSCFTDIQRDFVILSANPNICLVITGRCSAAFHLSCRKLYAVKGAEQL